MFPVCLVQRIFELRFIRFTSLFSVPTTMPAPTSTLEGRKKYLVLNNLNSRDDDNEDNDDGDDDDDDDDDDDTIQLDRR